jgi:signal transduction histidine kinase
MKKLISKIVGEFFVFIKKFLQFFFVNCFSITFALVTSFMKRKLSIFGYFLSIYVIAQFFWWGYHIVDLTTQLSGDTAASNKNILMIVGEGVIFLSILVFGIIKIRNSVANELIVSRNQNNFLLSVTHELKTPIASIKLYMQTLQKRNLSEEKRNEIIEKVLQQNEQLALLIDNILNATRLENKKLIANKEQLEVSKFLDAIVDRYKRQYPQIEFVNQVEKNISEKIDPFIFETIVNNLIENAIKYGASGRKITVELQKDTALKLRVLDNGPGIPAEFQKDIFKKFYRVGNEETRTQRGSGLGLFIVKELTHLHKGKIKYCNNQPTGAVFELTL